MLPLLIALVSFSKGALALIAKQTTEETNIHEAREVEYRIYHAAFTMKKFPKTFLERRSKMALCYYILLKLYSSIRQKCIPRFNDLGANVTVWHMSTALNEALYSEIEQYLSSDIIDATQKVEKTAG